MEREKNGHTITQGAITYPKDRGDRTLIRLTKGLLAKFHPEVPRNSIEYSVTQVEPHEIVREMKYFQLANGEFQSWRMVMDGKPWGGLWIYAFYDGVGFCVTHAENLAQTELELRA